MRLKIDTGCVSDKIPNWVTCPWPDDFLAVLEYQWNEAGAFAEAHGVRIAFEMHPGFYVYNPETLMKLRNAVGPVLGANFDHSNLVWQGIDVVAAILYLGDAINHFHAKDTKIDEINTVKIGVLDTKHYSDEINRAWVFRSVGYGHDMQWWRDVVSNLRLVGYDRVMSIEHEDSPTSIDEGLTKAINFLKEAILFDDKPGTMSWA